jgi:hypothetical protein
MVTIVIDVSSVKPLYDTWVNTEEEKNDVDKGKAKNSERNLSYVRLEAASHVRWLKANETNALRSTPSIIRPTWTAQGMNPTSIVKNQELTAQAMATES